MFRLKTVSPGEATGKVAVARLAYFVGWIPSDTWALNTSGRDLVGFGQNETNISDFPAPESPSLFLLTVSFPSPILFPLK